MFFDEKAELRLLAAFIDDQQQVLKVTQELFTSERKGLFIAFQECYKKYGYISSEGVELVYGRSITPELEMARGAQVAPIVDYLKVLATKRQLADLSNNINMMLNNPRLNIDEVQAMLTLKPLSSSDDSSITPGIAAFVHDLQLKQSGEYRFIDTGLKFLNHMLGGEWPRGAMTVIAAASGAGKTSMVCTSLLNMARKGIPVSFYSLEMPKKRIVPRLVANIAEVDGLALRTGKITEEERVRVDLALEEIQSLPFYFNDTTERPMSLNDILYYVQQHRYRYGIEAFFVDYLQIIADDGDDEKQVATLGRFTQQLRDIAVKEDIASIVLSQQNRANTGLASLLGSGRIGHIADVVILMRLADTVGEYRLAEIAFEKNRDGPTGQACAMYNGKYLRFTDS